MYILVARIQFSTKSTINSIKTKFLFKIHDQQLKQTCLVQYTHEKLKSKNSKIGIIWWYFHKVCSHLGPFSDTISFSVLQMGTINRFVAKYHTRKVKLCNFKMMYTIEPKPNTK